MASIRIAVTQAEPAWIDLAESVKRATALIAEAAAGGAKLVAFSECWIPGYPAWIWSVTSLSPLSHDVNIMLTRLWGNNRARPLDVELQTRYIYNSLAIESPAMNALKAAAREHNIAVVMGFSERSCPAYNVLARWMLPRIAGATLTTHTLRTQPHPGMSATIPDS